MSIQKYIFVFEEDENILYKFCKKEDINTMFEKCIRGYHLINTSVINEKTWEDINSLILESLYIKVYSKSNGSHLSGMDICCSFGKLSNKSSKYINNKKFSISSYRLTKVCNSKNIGDIKNIINEINKRKNFDYYSVIVRDENNTKTIEYDWYLIPSDYYILNPETYVKY